jgi:tripartite-type tricarboxylate transporter receptor subunit TctC
MEETPMHVRRRVVTSMLAAGVSAGFSTAARSQGAAPGYPSKPIRLIVPFAPGAANDIIARLIGDKVGEVLKQPFVIENRPGAGGSIGADLVAKAEPDGHTLLLTNPGPGVITPLMQRSRLYAVDDLEPVAIVCSAPLVLVANPAFPPNSPAELLAFAKTNPKKVTWGSADGGAIPSLALLLFQMATGADVVAVPYKGSAPAILDIAGGHLNVVYASYASAAATLQAGRAKVIGVAGPRRLAALPEVRTLAESGINDADAIVWFGIAAPAKTPRAVIDRLNREINRALELPDVRQRLAHLDLEPVGGTPESFRAVVKSEAAKVKRLIDLGLLKTE